MPFYMNESDYSYYLCLHKNTDNCAFRQNFEKILAKKEGSNYGLRYKIVKK